MSDFGGPGPSRPGRGGNGNRRPWRHRSHDGRGRAAGPAARGGRGRSAGPARGHVNAGPGLLGERPALSTATPEQETMLHQIVNNNAAGQGHSQQNSKNNNTQPSQRNNKGNTKRPMGFKLLEEISRSESVDIIEKINRQKSYFTLLLDSPVDKKKYDIFFLVLELITNVWKTSFEESKKLLLLDVCNTKFIDHLQLYLMQLPYTVSREDKYFNKYYWQREKEFWSHFMNFCECLINVSPATAVHKCGALIEATSKSCLEGLKEKQGFELPEEYTARMTKIRESLKVCDQVQTINQKRIEGIDEVGEPLESFRELSVLPTGAELHERRPFLRPNVVEGAYSDVEHYLDVQFRLLREDCFGPLREGIRKSRQLSVLPTGAELLERRPFLRPNVVEGAYSDVEHYLDVQFRLLREDCFGPLREGIRKSRQLSVLPTGAELLERRPFLRPNVVEGAYSDVEHYLDVQFRLLREGCFVPLREGIRNSRQLSVLPTGAELHERRPFLRPNVVEGAYSDVEHYLDVQFRLLREDCFGPLREGIRKSRQVSVLPTGAELHERRPFLRPNVVEGAYSDVEHYLDVQFRLLREDCFGPLREGIRKSRQVSVLPTGAELHERRPFLRPNVVEGAYSDVEHYLDVQFRLLREGCFGPLREGIHQYIEDPRRRKYDSIRVYQKVKFLEPYASKQKIGSIVLLDESTMKMIKRVNWAHSKRFLFGSLVVFSKDNCKSFLVGTILERDEKFLKKRQLPVNIVNSPMDANMYNNDYYIMIECEVYFEPYYHVLKALQDPSFPEHLAMSKYIVNIEKIPEPPAYLTLETEYKVRTKDLSKTKFRVLVDHTWPSQNELDLNSTQYEAYKLALTHEFAVIQGPPGTGKTFLGVKVAETLLRYAPFPQNKCSMLVICYTNHALDQFLEALLPFTQSLARIGGRSRNEALNRYNINNLRLKDNSSYYHERRIALKMHISALEHAQARVDALSSGVLSYKSIVAYNEECKILEHFYRGRNIKDVLKHWLFENVDDVPMEAEFLDQQIENEQPDEPENNEDIDDDIFARDEIDLDYLDDDDLPGEKPGYDAVTTSFSMPDKEEKIKSLLREFQDLQNKGRSRYELRDLEHKICQVYSEVKLFTDMMKHRSRPPRIRLTNALDLSTIPRVERWSLYFKWANVAMVDVKKKIKKIEEELKSIAEAYEEARMMVDLAVLKKTRVVGMTTTGAARLRKMLAEIAPPIMVVEEAAEVLESHIVTSLTKSCQHLILIGDHQQLRPSAAYMRLARHYDMEVSLFERMIRNGVHSRRLGVQHRMRPEIAALVSPHIYPELQNHRSVEDFPPVRGVAHNLFFFTHDYREQCEDDSSSRTNTQEADLLFRLANYLMQQGYKPDEVTILAAYSGQLFYMRKQRSLYDHLSNVKITVLDNYQGEESKIILLSLVRNNDNDSIGFLGTENRICVALSRAREGFFIFGNIDLLKRNSKLWTNIAATLEKNGSLGTSLKLQCVNHNGQTTTITSVNDFVKVPEGGCLLDCKYDLPCGHSCPRVCHAYDLQHANIQCIKDCERKICQIEGHKCPYKCAQECKPCKRLVEKSLPCGHNKAVACFKEPGDPSIKCTAPVDVTLPDCGHQATKECYMKTSDVKCKQKCPNSRLNCGHACRRTCHVTDDPDHERYTCLKPCPKAKKGCTANLEGDLGEHKCLRSCSEECVDCNVQVIKKRSGCTHSKRVACHEDVNAKPCREKCVRSLRCGHHCKKLCFEKCGDCKQKTKKPIPGCNHVIEIECGAEPTQDLCKMKCERVMACGHACRARCGESCDVAKCTEIVPITFRSPCGHDVELPCNISRTAMQTGLAVTAETLLSNCAAPCGAILKCNHTCGGSCSGCRQGRLHQPCAARCHQLNICGHRCEEPCNQVCPPCRRECEVKCPHSPCSRQCGAPCTLCAEPCMRSCPHSSCTHACGAPCSRPPCAESCARALACGHPCRGLCGEPCPPACRLCDPHGFPTDLLGDPYGDDDKLILLQDCRHMFDVDTLDTLMNSQDETVQLKACPWCRKPIVNTYRYKDLINRLLKNDINPIKEKVYGTNARRREKKLEMINKVTELQLAHQRTILGSKDWGKALSVIHKIINLAQKDGKISLLQLEMNDIYLTFLDIVGKYYMKYKDAHLSELETEMKSQVKLLCNVLIINSRKISEQQQLDMHIELKRLNSIIQLAKILSHVSYKSSKTNENVMQASAAAQDAVLSWRVFDESKGVECLKRLESAVKLSGIASQEERAMVVRAIGLRAGHWYKCPNGHFYCIGECGGAMQLSRCPECGAAIGGRNHTLTAGNQHAGEMDGSRFAAWSTAANNMANFNLDFE